MQTNYIQDFNCASHAFDYFYEMINNEGLKRANGTTRLTNIGFNILNPLDRSIRSDFRKWNNKYAEREWAWYISKNRSVEELKKFAPIWDKMHNGDNLVNSNYGFLWSENDQLEKIVNSLIEDTLTRQAWVTLYDGKNKDQYTHDTPCTLNIGFEIDGYSRLNMTVLMRSNDLWYGFCNDQFCFSKLYEMVLYKLNERLEKVYIGNYYHFAADLHLYDQHLRK